MLLLKTGSEQLAALETRLRQLHSYETPGVPGAAGGGGKPRLSCLDVERAEGERRIRRPLNQACVSAGDIFLLSRLVFLASAVCQYVEAFNHTPETAVRSGLWMPGS